MIFSFAAVVFVFLFVSNLDRYLSPDEALHVEVARPRSLLEVYRNSQFLAHPPLFLLLLSLWMRGGRSELFLRLLPAIFGVAFLWFAYRWASLLLGKVAAVATLVVIVVSSVWLPLSAELRMYSLLLLLTVAALAEFETAVELRSPIRIASFSVLLYLAILSHYSALFVTISVFLYALVRFRHNRPPRKVLLTWAAFQVGAVALYLFLYFTQVVRIRGSETESQTMAGWLGAGYFHQGQQPVVEFLQSQTVAVFRYFFGSTLAAAVAVILAATGLVSLALRRPAAAVLLALPFLFGAGAGLLGLYPLSGTRHCAYLLPFAAAAIGSAFSAFGSRRRWSWLLASTAILPVLAWAPVWSSPSKSLSHMNAAVRRLKNVAPAGSLLFADAGTAFVLRYYLDPWGPAVVKPAGYRLVRSPLWALDEKRFGDEVERMVRVRRLSAGQRFWVIRVGSYPDAVREVSSRFASASFRSSWTNGDISILEVWL